MHKILSVFCWITLVIVGACAFACWARNDMPDYPQDRRYTYEGDGYWISSHREIDETMLDEMSQSITIRDEEQIELGQRFLSELQLPKVIPEGYRFESLTITKYLSGRWGYVFTYEDVLRMNKEYIFRRKGSIKSRNK